MLLLEGGARWIVTSCHIDSWFYESFRTKRNQTWMMITPRISLLYGISSMRPHLRYLYFP